MIIYFIRHGQTNYNVEHRYQGMWGESELTQEGIAQAKALAPLLAGVAFDRLYVSAAKRAGQTADILFPGRQDAVYQDILREIDTGSLTELLDADCRLAYPEEFAQRTCEEDFSAWGGEYPAMTRDRAKKATDAITAGGGERIAVISHGAFIRVMLHILTGFPQSQAFSVMENCGVSAVKIEDGKAKLLFYNRTSETLFSY